jgi:RNA polymerase sigma-70 factor (ECF subfamily)
MEHFPSTRWDLLADAARRGNPSPDALNEFSERYYAAVRAFIAAVRHSREDADDLTQRFFETAVLSGRLFAHADPVKGRFRAYLKQAIRNFLVDEHRRRMRTPQDGLRAPDAVVDALSSAADQSPGPDEEMLKAWARSLIAMAVARLERACAEKQQEEHFALFRRRYMADADRPPSWRDLGQDFGLDEKTARSRADTAVRQFRVILRDLVATDIGAGADIDQELQEVMAIL